MGLDMYLYKIKKSDILEDETKIKLANDLYRKTDKNKDYFKVFEDNNETYTYTRYDFIGEETSLQKEIAYWRKVNSIHNWFYTNCAEEGQHDYDNIIIEKEKIEQLLRICKRLVRDVVLVDGKTIACQKFENGKMVNEYMDCKVVGNPELCKDLLPNIQGFFFGSTEYDEYYVEDIKDTIEKLEKVLEETDWENEFVYYYASY